MRAKEFINEVKMSQGVFKKFASSPMASDILVGFESELVFAGWGVDSSDSEEPDYSRDERIYDIDELFRWCNYNDGMNSSYAIRDAVGSLEREYDEWVVSEVDERKENLIDQFRDFRAEQWRNTDHSSEVREKLEDEGYDSDEIDGFIDDQTSEYENALSELRDEYDDDTETDIRRESGEFEDYLSENLDDTYDLELSDYLEREGITHVSDFYESAGLDWPIYSNQGGEYEYNQPEAELLAERLSYDLGITVEAMQFARHKKLDRWYIESDVSIEPDKDDPAELPVEIVSPPMPLNKSLTMMREFFAWARANGAYANESTGFHVSVSVPNLQNIDYVKLVLFLGDEHVLNEFGRLNNTFAKSALKILRDKTSGITPELLRSIFEKMKSGANKLASAMVAMRNPDKYVSVNVKSDYVEFRSGGNSGYIDAAQIEMVSQVVSRYAYALTIACDENMYKNEYLTKLAKLLSPKDKTEKSIVSAFARYSVDKDLSALRTAVQGLKKETPKHDESREYMVFVYQYMTNLILGIKQRVKDIRILKYEEILTKMSRDFTMNKDEFYKRYVVNVLKSLESDKLLEQNQFIEIMNYMQEKFESVGGDQ